MTKGLIGLKALSAISLLLFVSSCSWIPKKIHPQISYSIQDHYIKALPSAFTSLSEAEAKTPWGIEYLVGKSFARNLDFYRAITAFRRAEILLPEENISYKQQIHYEILLSYYLGKQYAEVERTFAESDLASATPHVPPFQDLLVILYDTYLHLGETQKKDFILQLIHTNYPETYAKLLLYTALEKADFTSLHQQKLENTTLSPLLHTYEKQKKSLKTAAFLNGIFPGSGYLYIGQISTAITAFLVNFLFIVATIYFFLRKPIVVAIIFLGFEMGWYVGGIHGGALQAKTYNERTYEKLFKPYMYQEGLFPIYQLHYGN